REAVPGVRGRRGREGGDVPDLRGDVRGHVGDGVGRRGKMRKLIAAAVVMACAGWGRAAVGTLDWDAVTTNAGGTASGDLGGYRVFYATYSLQSMTTAQAMSAGTVTKVAAGTNTSAVSGLSNQTTYYFRVTAYDNSGNQSDFCDTPVEVSTT